MSDYVLGKSSTLSKSKVKLASIKAPLNVGDIVAPYKYYKNGRPIPASKHDYTAGKTGLVVDEYVHADYHQLVIKVVWNSNSHYSSATYMKDSSGSYLIKLS